MQHGTFSRQDIAAWQQESPSFRAGRMSTAIEQFVTKPFGSIEVVQKFYARPVEQITDHNMVTEFKYGKALY
jgi:hypothetical protein